MKQAPLESEQELEWIKAYVLYPILMDVLHRDIAAMRTVPLKMAVLYIRVLTEIQDKVLAEISSLRKQLATSKIRVFEPRRTKLGVEAQYMIRGYRRHFSMLWSVVKAELEKELSIYFDIDLGAFTHEK